ncbi:MAG: OmpA family protein [Bacteroidia bacterium]
MKKLLPWLVLPLLFICVSSFAQNYKDTQTSSPRARQLYLKAVSYFLKHQTTEAEILLKKAIVEDSAYADARMLLADIYHKNGQYEEEKDQLRTLNRMQPDFADAYLNLGVALYHDAEYEEAVTALENFISKKNQDSRFIPVAKRRLEEAQFSADQVKNPVPFKPENLGPGVNTEMDEYWPAVTADEKTLFFTRLKPMESDAGGMFQQEDIYISQFNNGKWDKSQFPPGSLNSQDNEGAITISPDGKWLIFTGCNRRDGMGRCDFYISKLQHGAWTQPRNMGTSLNTRDMETQPSLSFDGRTLYFSSNRPGGKGGLDLWKSDFDPEEGWQEPVNLGDEVNTEDDEQSPFIHHDNKTLYFSSRGHIGLGQADLYKSELQENGMFGNVTNLGYPINTNKDEISIFVTSRGDKAFISSQANSLGGRDIFSFDLYEEVRPELVTYLKGMVYDLETKKPISAKVELLDVNTGEPIIEGYSDEQTGVLLALPGNRNYALHVSKEGYLFYSDHLALKNYKSPEPYERDINLSKIKEGEKIVLRNIFYDVDSFNLEEKSRTELQLLIGFLKENPNLRIEISGHTDSDGSAPYNQTLSDKRAKSVLDYLVREGGIREERLVSIGFGESKPMAENTTEEGKALNRRTELKIISL